MRLKSKQSGFTLVEVLIALTILSVSVLGIIQSISVCSHNATKALRLTEATGIARREMALAVLAKGSGSPATGGDGVFQWKVETSEKAENLLLISVAVTWQERGRPQVFRLSRMLDVGKGEG